MRRETNQEWNVVINSNYTGCDLTIKIHSIREVENENAPMLIYIRINDSIFDIVNKSFYGKTVRQCMRSFKRYLNNILPKEEVFYIDYSFIHEKLFFVPKENQFDNLKDYFQMIKESTDLDCISDYSTNY